jgi:hypothetical protein
MPTFAFHLEAQAPAGTRACEALRAMCERLLGFSGDIPERGGNGVHVTRCAPIERDETDNSLPRLVHDSVEDWLLDEGLLERDYLDASGSNND